jgi:hypothetical protein
MQRPGVLSDYFSPLVGTGPGSGLGLLIFLCGVGATLVGLTGYVIRPIRKLDEILPDHDALPIPVSDAYPPSLRKPTAIKETEVLHQES